MSDLEWIAEGLELARACGGVDLDVYVRPGFTGGLAVRKASSNIEGSGFSVPDETDEDFYDDRARRDARNTTRVSSLRHLT